MCNFKTTLIDAGYSRNRGCGCQGAAPGYRYGGCCCRREIVPAYTPDVIQPADYDALCGCGASTYARGCESYEPCRYMVPASIRLPSGFAVL
ncbi:MAG: hypothetical protein LBD85_00735 [Oscillospiraceae bacterium]|nr:hypothetical protein [Oscillospiraceae bacterium]